MASLHGPPNNQLTPTTLAGRQALEWLASWVFRDGKRPSAARKNLPIEQAKNIYKTIVTWCSNTYVGLYKLAHHHHGLIDAGPRLFCVDRSRAQLKKYGNID